MLSHVWQCKYEIDHDLVFSFKVLQREIDNIFIGKRNTDYVWQSVQHTSKQDLFQNNYDGRKILFVHIE